MKKKVTIDIISDIICPWCYIGKSRLMRAIEAVGDDFEVMLRLRPFQLYPNVPKGGLPKKDFPKIRKTGLGSALKEAATEENIVFNYKDIEVISNTLEGHRLMSLCKDNKLKNRLEMALFVSYFEKAEDLEDPLVLARIARDAKMPKEKIDQFLHSNIGEQEVIYEIENLKAEGVTAVPSYILNNDILVVGVQPMKNWLRFFDRLNR